VGLAGPVLGSLGALVALGLYALTGDELFKALAFVGFLLNLFNLLPVLPLDGGRAMAALSPWMWFVGYGLLVAATVAFPNPVMLLVLLFGGLETWRRWQARKTPEAREFKPYRQDRPTTADLGRPRLGSGTLRPRVHPPVLCMVRRGSGVRVPASAFTKAPLRQETESVAATPKKNGAGATPGRASSRPSKRQAARQGQVPDPAL
jgi:hypothetical protein